jgi:acetolactate synthase-1/3 small subunit
MVEEHTLSLLVNNKPGVLSRLAGVFSRQGYNIKTLCVAETKNADVSRVTLTAEAEGDFTDKIKKQLNKLIDIIEVLDYTGAGFVHREMMLIGIPVKPQDRSEILKAVEIFGCKITTMSPDYYVLEITGTKEETAAVFQYLQAYGANEVNRTGTISVCKTRP